MKNSRLLIAMLLTVVLALSLVFTRMVLAQGSDPTSPAERAAPETPENRSNYIPIQGRLTDSEGRALDGDYSITFSLYDSYSSTIPLCAQNRLVQVREGLFNSYFEAVGCSIDGRQLYLGIQVEDDEEMSPRQYVDNVVYAWTLRPGAVISDTLSTAILHIENWAATGRGLRSYAMSESGANYGVVGASRSPEGFGGYFYNNGGGVGVAASSNSAASPGVRATGIDSGPDLILGGNAETGVGDDGILASDPGYASSDIILRANDTLRIDLDNDGDGEDADFEIRDKDDNLIFDVDESGTVVYGGAGIAAFPRPAYDSGWVSLSAGASIDLNHNLGGSADNYVVDLSFKHPTYGTHNFGYGGDVTSGAFYGAYWQNLTTTSITVVRATNDGECPQVRVRIWMYP